MGSGNFLIGCLVKINIVRFQSFMLIISLYSVQFCELWKIPKFSKVGNYCGNLSLPSGNLLVLDLVTLVAVDGENRLAADENVVM